MVFVLCIDPSCHCFNLDPIRMTRQCVTLFMFDFRWLKGDPPGPDPSSKGPPPKKKLLVERKRRRNKTPNERKNENKIHSRAESMAGKCEMHVSTIGSHLAASHLLPMPVAWEFWVWFVLVCLRAVAGGPVWLSAEWRWHITSIIRPSALRRLQPQVAPVFPGWFQPKSQNSFQPQDVSSLGRITPSLFVVSLLLFFVLLMG